MSLFRQNKTLRTDLGRARGLGSAHHGSSHWWAQRLSAIALVPLCIWFLIGIFRLNHQQGVNVYTQAQDFISTPWNTVLAVLLILSLFQHMQLGLQVIIEDYIPNTAKKFITLIFIKFICITLAVVCLLSIISIAL